MSVAATGQPEKRAMAMKAITSREGRVRWEQQYPEPMMPADAAIITVRCCALLPDDCPAGSDNAAVHDGVIGAAFVGTAGEAGRDAGKPLRRVTAELRDWCGSCERCRAGLRQYCAAGRRLGSAGRAGVMSERCALPASALIDVPDHLGDDAVLFSPLIALAIAVQRLAGLPRAAFVTVLGDGAQGLIMAQILSRANARVRVLGSDPSRYALCERWGIPHRPLEEAGWRGDQEMVIECTGTPDNLETAAGLVRPRGTVVVAGTASRSRVLPADLMRADATVYCVTSGSIREAIDLCARSAPDTVSLIGRQWSGEEAAARLDRGMPDPGGLLDVVRFVAG